MDPDGCQLMKMDPRLEMRAATHLTIGPMPRSVAQIPKGVIRFFARQPAKSVSSSMTSSSFWTKSSTLQKDPSGDMEAIVSLASTESMS